VKRAYWQVLVAVVWIACRLLAPPPSVSKSADRPLTGNAQGCASAFDTRFPRPFLRCKQSILTVFPFTVYYPSTLTHHTNTGHFVIVVTLVVLINPPAAPAFSMQLHELIRIDK
jgi:hypothetical protein